MGYFLIGCWYRQQPQLQQWFWYCNGQLQLPDLFLIFLAGSSNNNCSGGVSTTQQQWTCTGCSSITGVRVLIGHPCYHYSTYLIILHFNVVGILDIGYFLSLDLDSVQHSTVKPSALGILFIPCAGECNLSQS